jgi:copper homeostasis protein CutC
VTIPVHPIIRPRGGDFCYTESEFAAMLTMSAVRELGFPGLVTGVLDADGQVDIPRMKNNGRGRAAGGDLSSRVRSVRRPASGLEDAG